MSHTITDEQIREAVARLDALDGADPERDHAKADQILRDLVPPEVRSAREAAHNRAKGLWWA